MGEEKGKEGEEGSAMSFMFESQKSHTITILWVRSVSLNPPTLMERGVKPRLLKERASKNFGANLKHYMDPPHTI